MHQDFIKFLNFFWNARFLVNLHRSMNILILVGFFSTPMYIKVFLELIILNIYDSINF
jgi:hypothetical protein